MFGGVKPGVAERRQAIARQRRALGVGWGALCALAGRPRPPHNTRRRARGHATDSHSQATHAPATWPQDGGEALGDGVGGGQRRDGGQRGAGRREAAQQAQPDAEQHWWGEGGTGKGVGHRGAGAQGGGQPPSHPHVASGRLSGEMAGRLRWGTAVAQTRGRAVTGLAPGF